MPSATGSPLSANRTGTIRYLRQRAGRGAARHGKVDVAAPDVRYHLAQRLRIAGRIVQFQGNVLALDIAPRAQSLAEPVQERVGLGLGGNPENAINPCRIMRQCGDRPSHRSTDKQYEISSFHAGHYGPDRTSRLRAGIQITCR